MPTSRSASTKSPKNEPKPKREPKPKGKPGRPPDSGFQPTPEQRGAVEAMTGFGITMDEMCLLITNPQTGNPICKHTLIKYFRQELDRGKVSVKAKIVRSLYTNAVEHNNVTAQIFWLKTQCGWKEEKEEELPPPAEDLDNDDKRLEAARRVAFMLTNATKTISKK